MWMKRLQNWIECGIEFCGSRLWNRRHGIALQNRNSSWQNPKSSFQIAIPALYDFNKGKIEPSTLGTSDFSEPSKGTWSWSYSEKRPSGRLLNAYPSKRLSMAFTLLLEHEEDQKTYLVRNNEKESRSETDHTRVSVGNDSYRSKSLSVLKCLPTIHFQGQGY